jgi:hypothetical protein
MHDLRCWLRKRRDAGKAQIESFQPCPPILSDPPTLKLPPSLKLWWTGLRAGLIRVNPTKSNLNLYQKTSSCRVPHAGFGAPETPPSPRLRRGKPACVKTSAADKTARQGPSNQTESGLIKVNQTKSDQKSGECRVTLKLRNESNSFNAEAQRTQRVAE